MPAGRAWREGLVSEVVHALRETGLDPHRLKLEITGSVMMPDSAPTLDDLHAPKALGVELAVDDLGTGYPSMAYLSSLRIDTLKIDRSVVGKIGSHPEREATIRMIVTDAQHAYLQDLNCGWDQDCLLARPLTPVEAGGLLDRARGDAPLASQRLTRRAA